MQLEEYVDYVGPDEIRIRNSRVGIETVLLDFLDGAHADEIHERYPTLTLEEVYATITYYLAHRQAVDGYLRSYLERSAAAQRRFDASPPPGVRRLRELKARQQAPAGVAVP